MLKTQSDCYRGNNIYANIPHRRRSVRFRVRYRLENMLLWKTCYYEVKVQLRLLEPFCFAVTRLANLLMVERYLSKLS